MASDKGVHMNTKARVVVESSGVVNVHVKPEVLFDLKAIQSLHGQILGKLGCMACCSGYQIIFKGEESEFAVG
jgi:hypothetical protein